MNKKYQMGQFYLILTRQIASSKADGCVFSVRAVKYYVLQHEKELWNGAVLFDINNANCKFKSSQGYWM